jgi:hypothetical protein
MNQVKHARHLNDSAVLIVNVGLIYLFSLPPFLLLLVGRGLEARLKAALARYLDDP